MMFKRIRGLLCCVLTAILTACAPIVPQNTPGVTPSQASPMPAVLAPTPVPAAAPTPTPVPAPLFALEDYPVVDGSTATLPLSARIMAATTGITRDDAENRVRHNTTPEAYALLVTGQCDLLLAYEPAASTTEIIETSGVELEFHPIGRDALVFIVNESNPVHQLTTAQLQDIYQGNITNWKDLGGNDLEIVPFQRSESSGSQALFLKLLMKDKTPMDAPTEFMPTDMGELIDGVAEYDNSGAALGYSVFYYAHAMYSKPGLRFLGVDGVAPSDATLTDQTYPFLNDFYAVIRKDAPADGPARKLANWILSESGAQAIRDAGYIAIS